MGGCVSSKQAVAVTPTIDYSGVFHDNGTELSVTSLRYRAECEKKKVESGRSEFEESRRGSSNGGGDSFSLRLGNLQKYVEGEQVAAGWPPWLSAVAGEAIQGWIPLRADSFEKLEKMKKKCKMRRKEALILKEE